jgi:hypothetical protein
MEDRRPAMQKMLGRAKGNASMRFLKPKIKCDKCSLVFSSQEKFMQHEQIRLQGMQAGLYKYGRHANPPAEIPQLQKRQNLNRLY